MRRRETTIPVDGGSLPGTLTVPDDPAGVVVFAHGSGSSRHSPRNRQVADGLADAGFATLLFDLLTDDESRDRRNVFDIPLLGGRLGTAVDQLGEEPEVGDLPAGLFGASTGAAAALDAAATRADRVRAVVSRGGRPDLATRPQAVTCPVLLIVGSEDGPVIGMNEQAARDLAGPTELDLVEGAGHLFEGPGQLEEVTVLATRWFRDHLVP
ncbi:MAG: dienelactone hydrolase family protein [Actinobacteria bacterium]|nr:dienelactone hydrolase family protein [Actinomycetota bacterium]